MSFRQPIIHISEWLPPPGEAALSTKVVPHWLGLPTGQCPESHLGYPDRRLLSSQSHAIICNHGRAAIWKSGKMAAIWKKWPLQCGDQWPLMMFLQNQKFKRTKSRHFAQSSDCKIGIYGCGEDVCGDRITLCDNFSIPTFSEAWERLVPWPLLPHSIEISRWAKENHRKRVALQALGVALSHLDGGIPPGKLQKGRDGTMMMVMVVVMLMVILIMAKIILM